MTRRTYVCCCPTPSVCCDTSVWPTSGPIRLNARQLASVAFWSGSVALPLSVNDAPAVDVHSTVWSAPAVAVGGWFTRSEEHTSELQSRRDLVCRLLLEKK